MGNASDAWDEGRLRALLKTLALVAVGGFVGADLRFAVASLLPGLPGTLAVNALGSLALGFLVREVRLTGALAGRTRLLVGTGFLSSFTTYSTFAVQTVRAPGALPAVNVVANYGLGFVGVLVGHALATRFATRRGADDSPDAGGAGDSGGAEDAGDAADTTGAEDAGGAADTGGAEP